MARLGQTGVPVWSKKSAELQVTIVAGVKPQPER